MAIAHPECLMEQKQHPDSRQISNVYVQSSIRLVSFQVDTAAHTSCPNSLSLSLHICSSLPNICKSHARISIANRISSRNSRIYIFTLQFYITYCLRGTSIPQAYGIEEVESLRVPLPVQLVQRTTRFSIDSINHGSIFGKLEISGFTKHLDL